MNKQYLVQLTRPVVIDDCYHEAPIKQAVYGFIGQYNEYDPEENAYHEYLFRDYCGYLAALHQWTANGGEEFTVTDKEWFDLNGNPLSYEQRVYICQRDRETLGLDFVLHVIDLDDISGDYLECGMQGSIIISPILMDKLIELADRQEEENRSGAV